LEPSKDQSYTVRISLDRCVATDRAAKKSTAEKNDLMAKVKLARAYRVNGLLRKAREMLASVIREAPKSKAAEEAQKELDEMNREARPSSGKTSPNG